VIFHYEFITNPLHSLLVKEFKSQSAFGKLTVQSSVSHLISKLPVAGFCILVIFVEEQSQY